MSATNRVLTMILLVMIPFAVIAAGQDDGRTYFTVKGFVANTDSCVGNEFATGLISVVLTDGLYVKREDYYDDGAYFEYAISTGWIDENVLSTAAGDGISWDAINDEFDVNTGDGLVIIGDNVRVAVDGINDTMIDWGTGAGSVSGTDIPLNTTNFDNNLGAGDSDVLTAFETLDDMDVGPPGADTQVPYNDGGAWGATSDLTLTAISLNVLRGGYFHIGTGVFEVRTTAVDDAFVVNGTADAVEIIIPVAIGGQIVGTYDHRFNTDGSSIFNEQGDSTGDFRAESDSHTNALFIDASADTISVVGTEFYIGDADTQTDLLLADGSANYVSIVTQAMAADYEVILPAVVGTTNQIPYVAGSTGAGSCTLGWKTDTNTHVDTITGYLAGETSGGAFVDQYADLDPAATITFAGTGVNDIVGYGLPWNVSIVGISANYLLIDLIGVSTIDIFPREDGANIHAACKLTLAETGANRDSTSATFAAGTYTVSANQTINIYIDVTNGGAGVVDDLIVTVYYHYSL